MIDPHRQLEHLKELATKEPDKRFDKLHKIVRQEPFLVMVWNRVQQNKGSKTPGIDGQTKADIDDQMLTELGQDLKTGRYQPHPVRRVYIPKGKGQRRGLGIPTMRDRIVQGAIAQVLEAVYEPLFRDSSYGFRPQRSTIHALRHVARAYRSDATWIIEGDLLKCFDNLSHKVILNCLRKRVKDERFINLVRLQLQAGVMEDFRYHRTYSGAPQGGLCSPILTNIVLHEFDCWMEGQWSANPPPLTRQQRLSRRNPSYLNQTANLTRWRAQLRGDRPMGQQTPAGLRQKIKAATVERNKTRCYLPRKVIYYCRFADDYIVILCGYPKAVAEQLKQAMADWLQTELGLTQHPQKTVITHWSDPLQFLGYELRGQRNQNGTRWLKLTIPPAAERNLKQRIKQLCSYTQIPRTDLFISVNALVRGWTAYYRYAHNATSRFSYLSGVVFWLTAHYLGRIHRRSIKKVMRSNYGTDPKTGRKALYITRPNGKVLFIWNKPPKRRSLLNGRVEANDTRPLSMTSWAAGRSYEQRLAVHHAKGTHCEHCSQEHSKLMVHHPRRLAQHCKLKQGPANIIQSAQEQQPKLLCPDCHLQHHHGTWN